MLKSTFTAGAFVSLAACAAVASAGVTSALKSRILNRQPSKDNVVVKQETPTGPSGPVAEKPAPAKSKILGKRRKPATEVLSDSVGSNSGPVVAKPRPEGKAGDLQVKQADQKSKPFQKEAKTYRVPLDQNLFLERNGSLLPLSEKLYFVACEFHGPFAFENADDVFHKALDQIKKKNMCPKENNVYTFQPGSDKYLMVGWYSGRTNQYGFLAIRRLSPEKIEVMNMEDFKQEATNGFRGNWNLNGAKFYIEVVNAVDRMNFGYFINSTQDELKF